MLSIANEVDSLIFCCVCFVYDTNYVFPTGITSSFLKWGLTSRKRASSLSLAFCWKGPQVLPWCNALSRGGGILLIPSILLSRRWQWLLMTSTAWPTLASRGPSLVWMACQVSSWALTCWGGITSPRPSATMTWSRITCFSRKGLQRSAVKLAVEF